jgi:predicted alpha/beta-hydrolase family hydrolase
MKPLLLFAHGAGLPSTSEWMERWAGYLSTLGRVERFDYPYMAAGKKRPDRHPVLLEAHRAALDRHRRPDEPVVLIGKSMGSRIGCHLAAEVPVRAVVCLGYPLAGMGNRAKLRDAVLLEQRQPVLFVQGTRDKLCPLDLLDETRARMMAPTSLHVVETGDHSLHVTKTWSKQTGLSQPDADAAAVDAIRAFLQER